MTIPSTLIEESPEFAAVTFGRSAGSMNVALVDEQAYAMVLTRDGKHSLVSGWRMRCTMPEWT